MSEEAILARLEALDAKNARLELEVERAHAVNDIARLIGHYYTNHIPGESDEFMTMSSSWQLFADRPDTTYEVANFGLFVGFDNVRAFLQPPKRPGEENAPKGLGKGAMFEHNLCTPQIVVAADGQTGRGIWQVAGHETVGPDMCEWAWGRVAADFIKVDGEWKIWHYHYYRIFRSPFDTPWNKYDQNKVSRARPKESYREAGGDPERILPTTYFNPFSLDTALEPIPPCPAPYETWSDDRLPI